MKKTNHTRRNGSKGGGKGVPVLCRFWREDGVWNAIAVELPVAVFGKTFEQARDHLREAIETHCLALQDAGEFSATIRRLRARARSSVAMKSIPPGSPLMKMTLANTSRHRVTVAA